MTIDVRVAVVWQLDFDNFENHVADALVKKIAAAFVGKDSEAIAASWIAANPPVKTYQGWAPPSVADDSKAFTYPQFYVEAFDALEVP